MRKIFTLLTLLVFFSNSFAQTIIGTENFEAASPNWILNSTDLGCVSGNYNEFVINNAYAGGTYNALGFWPIVIDPVPNQPAAITNSPRSRYLHITAKDACSQGICNANYLAGFGAEGHFAKMNYDWNTTGKTGVYLTFYWLGVGSMGYLYYSTNSGATWTLADGTVYNNQPNWIQKTVTNSAFDNQATLRFAFLFNDGGTAADPPLSVDQLELKCPAATPVADFSASKLSICVGECISFTDLTTNSPTSWSWTFNGAGTTNSTVQNPANICYNTPGNYTVTLVATNANGSDTETKTSYINVTANTTPTFSFETDYCVGETPATLPANSDNGVNGAWAPATINTTTSGSANYIFTPAAGQCAIGSTVPVNVTANTTPTFSFQTSYCVGEAAAVLPATSDNGVGGSWSPATINTATAGNATYTFTPTAGICAVSVNVPVNVSTSITPTFSFKTDYCVGEAAAVLPATSDDGIDGTWSPATINTATVGNSTYTFTPSSGGCAISVDVSVNVTAKTTPTFSFETDYCAGETAEALPTTSDNGVTGTWSPATINTSTVGSATYTFTPTAGLCANSVDVPINVAASITPTFSFQADYCAGETPDILPASSDNGVTGTWNPATINTAAAGSFIYTFTPAANQCANNVNVDVNVTASITPTFSFQTGYCVGETAATLPATSDNGVGGTWSPATINTTTAGSSTYTFTPTAGLCASSLDVTVNVSTPTTPAFSFQTSYCVGEAPASLPASSDNGVNGTWSPATINTSVAGNATYTFTPTAGQCASNLDVIVNSLETPVASILGEDSICPGDTVSLIAQGTGSYSWSGGSSLPQLTVSPDVTTEYTLVVSNNGCNDTTTHTVNLYPDPIAYAGEDIEITQGASVFLFASQAVSYEWFPATFLSCSDCQNPICTPEVSMLYTLTITDINGCKATDDIFVHIDENCGTIYGPNVFSPNDDGINDVFFLQGNCIKSLEIRIFNRWGNMLYESFDPDFSWDGMNKGEKVANGVYFYVYKVTFEDGTTKSGKSSLTLLR